MLNGYIKLFRSFKNWGWYSDGNTTRVFLELLLRARFTEGSFEGVLLKPGQAVYSRASLSKDLKLTERNVRTAIKHLESTGELTIKTTSKFSIATIVNWGKWQLSDDESTNIMPDEMSNNRPTIDQQSTNNRPHIKNERKKEGKKVKNKIPPSVDEIRRYICQGNLCVDAEAFIDYYTSNGWKIGSQPMKDWQAAVRTWDRKERSKHGNGNSKFNNCRDGARSQSATGTNKYALAAQRSAEQD